MFELPEGYTLRGGSETGTDTKEARKAAAPANEMGLAADVVETVDGRKTESAIFYNKGAKSRIEYGDTAKFNILRMDKEVEWTIYPDRKSYRRYARKAAPGGPSKSFDVDAVIWEMGLPVEVTKTLLGQEKVNGYLCDKYSLGYKDGNSQINTALVWYAVNPGMVTRMEGLSNTKMVRTDFTNIRAVDLPDSLFEVPEGYTEIK
jgi:hypothetical protein